MLPERAELFAAPVHTPALYEEKVGFWRSVYGIDMSTLLKPAQQYWIQRPIITYDVRPDHLIASPVLIKALDMRTATVQDLDFLELEWLWRLQQKAPGEISQLPDKSTAVSGFVGWFDCHFGEPTGKGEKDGSACSEEEITLSTAPVPADGAVEPTHWKQSLFLFDEPVVLPPGTESAECIAMMKRNESHPRHYHVAFSLQVKGMEHQVQKCWRLWR